MSVDLSKIGYGAIVASATGSGIVLSKAGYGAIVADATGSGIVLSKAGYGIIVDTLTPESTPSARRRQCSVVN